MLRMSCLCVKTSLSTGSLSWPANPEHLVEQLEIRAHVTKAQGLPSRVAAARVSTLHRGVGFVRRTEYLRVLVSPAVAELPSARGQVQDALQSVSQWAKVDVRHTCRAEWSSAQPVYTRQAVEAVVLKKLSWAVLGRQQRSLHNLVVEAVGAQN